MILEYLVFDFTPFGGEESVSSLDFFNILMRIKSLTNSYFKINIALDAAYL